MKTVKQEPLSVLAAVSSWGGCRLSGRQMAAGSEAQHENYWTILKVLRTRKSTVGGAKASSTVQIRFRNSPCTGKALGYIFLRRFHHVFLLSIRFLRAWLSNKLPAARLNLVLEALISSAAPSGARTLAAGDSHRS